jgi:AraC-like DNA-binding protein
MKNIREAVHDVIAQRIIPWVERDGISKLLLPEQITPADCIRVARCNRVYSGHREHDLGIGLTGKAPYCIDGNAFVLTPGKIIFMPSGTPQSSAQTKERHVRYLNLNKPPTVLWLTFFPFGIRVQTSHMAVDRDTLESTQPYILLDRYCNMLSNRLLEEIRFRPPNYAGVGRCILMEIMQRCLRATPAAVDTDVMFVASRHRSRPAGGSQKGKKKSTRAGSKQPPAQVKVAQEFIYSNYHMPITLDDISEAANISIDHLGRLFKAAIGTTPIQYLIDVRIKASEQLLLTDLKIREVAHMVGVEDHHYFSRLFHRNRGVSPLAYRQKMAKVARPTPAMKD